MTDTTTRTEADAVAEIALSNQRIELIDIENPETGESDVKLASVPAGRELQSIKELVDEYRLNPERRKGTARFTDLASFIEHTKRFQDDDSVIFANPDPKAPTLTSVLNYHDRGPHTDAQARHCDHRGVYTFPVSDEWAAWRAKDGVSLSQTDFATFIEDRLLDIVDPQLAGESAKAFAVSLSVALATPAKLIELSRGLSIRVDSKVKEVRNLQTGEAQIQFETEHQDDGGAPLKVPGAFLIGIPVFREGALYQIPVRLRYRVSGPRVSWSFELYRLDRAFTHAFNEARDLAAKETELPVYSGTPEA